jgi:Domain of unknown function (DUF4375)
VDLDWRALCALPPAELVLTLLAEVERQMAGLTDQQEDDLLATLPDPLGALWVLSWLEFEVTQGSLLAYFYNTHGRHATRAADALDEIGAHRMAAALRRAIESMSAVEEEWAAQRARMSQFGEYAVVRPYLGLSNAELLDQLTDEYWTAADDDEWGGRLEAFVVQTVSHQASH